MIWSAPVENEHKAVLKYIKHLRSRDTVLCVVFALPGLILFAAGIYAVIDKFPYAFGFFVVSVILLLIAGGCILTNAAKYKLIRNREYEVCRCRVISREALRTKYSTDYKVTVLVLSDGKYSTYSVSSITYRKAKENAGAILVDYSMEHEGKRDIPFDMVIPDFNED
ncbi:MAG: phage holin family protein [Clostridiales bacterium]|nr:phage holin family protein [Clostridiales bacterium]